MDKKIVFLSLMLTILPTVFSTDLKFKDCGSQVGKILKISTQPDVSMSGRMYVIHKGKNYTISVTFASTETTKQAHAQVYGIVAGIPVPFPLPNTDGCNGSGISCPIMQGETYTYSTTLPVSRLYPSVKVIVKWELFDSTRDTGNKLFCFESGFAVMS